MTARHDRLDSPALSDAERIQIAYPSEPDWELQSAIEGGDRPAAAKAWEALRDEHAAVLRALGDHLRAEACAGQDAASPASTAL